MGKGGGGSPPPSSSTVTQTNLPDYVEPYFKRLLERTESESKRAYTPYGGDRLAGTSADIKAVEDATRRMAQQGTPYIGEAMDTTRAGIQAAYGAAGYRPGEFTMPGQGITQFTGPSATMDYSDISRFDPSQFTGPAGVTQFTGPSGPAQLSGIRSGVQQFTGPAGVTQFTGPSGPAQLSKIRSQVQQFSGPSAVSQFSQVGPSGEFDAAAAQQYMDPYMQQVVDVQKREAIQEAQKAQAGRAAQAIGAGAFGGSREGIVQAEAAKSLQEQLGDIQAIGSQQAFKQAQEQFERDRAARMGQEQQRFQIEQSQEQAVRRFEDMGFSREQAQEQVFRQMEQQRQSQEQAQADLVSRFEEAGFTREQAQESAQRQMEQQRFETEKTQEQAFRQMEQQRMAQEQAQADLVSRFEEAGFSRQQAQEQAQRTMEQQRLQTEQAREQGLRSQEQLRLSQQQAQQQAVRDMEGMRFETEKARESAIQARYNQLLQAQQAQEQARLAGAQFGLEGLKTGMAGAEQLAELGAKGQGLTIEQLRNLEQVGKAEQARRQQALDMAYQDYMRQRDYPREQLQFYSSILRGVPVSPSQEQATYQQVNPLQQLLGTGLAGLSLYKGLGG